MPMNFCDFPFSKSQHSVPGSAPPASLTCFDPSSCQLSLLLTSLICFLLLAFSSSLLSLCSFPLYPCLSSCQPLKKGALCPSGPAMRPFVGLLQHAATFGTLTGPAGTVAVTTDTNFLTQTPPALTRLQQCPCNQGLGQLPSFLPPLPPGSLYNLHHVTKPQAIWTPRWSKESPAQHSRRPQLHPKSHHSISKSLYSLRTRHQSMARRPQPG